MAIFVKKMSPLKRIYPYFWKYKLHFISGIFCIILSNFFGILFPKLTSFIIGIVENADINNLHKDFSFQGNWLFQWVLFLVDYFKKVGFGLVTICCILILVFTILKGFFMFLMRQTIIVMSRHIEFDQKNEIYTHYQSLDMEFFKNHQTGDLMNRISEDVSRVRMFTGPAIMYLINLTATVFFCLYNMFKKDVQLSLIVLSPLPFLSIAIYYINKLIHKKSEIIQANLSTLTTKAQEAYSGIRVIKSFAHEQEIITDFQKNAKKFQKNAISLALVESIYFPCISLIIGISTLFTIYVGTKNAYINPQSVGTIVEFIIYLNLLTFPVSAIGWTTSMIQRASASQKRINEFLDNKSNIKNAKKNNTLATFNSINISNVHFIYSHSNIKALNNLNLQINKNERVLILGKVGSGKSSLMQLLLRLYDVNSGTIYFDNTPIKDIDLHYLRKNICFVSQENLLFSDTIANNISFSMDKNISKEKIIEAAKMACLHNEIMQFTNQYDTVIGERGVTLSGGQKQRLSIARAVLKESPIYLFDDCLSAIDVQNEQQILHNLNNVFKDKILIFISHKIFHNFNFDKIIYLDNGQIIEEGTKEDLLMRKGKYYALYHNKKKIEEI